MIVFAEPISHRSLKLRQRRDIDIADYLQNDSARKLRHSNFEHKETVVQPSLRR